MKQDTDKPVRRAAVKIVVLYALVAGLWIYLSDHILADFTSDSLWLTQLQTFKGLAFVSITSLLLFVLIQYYLSRLLRSRRLRTQLSKRLRSLIDVSPAVNFLLTVKESGDPELWITDNIRPLLGVSDTRTITPELLRERLHPEDADSVGQALRTGFASREPVERIFRLTSADGSYCWMQLQLRFVAEREDGAPEFAGSLTDATLIKAGEDALAKSALRQKLFFDRAMDGICIHDQDLMVVEANQAFSTLLGLASPSEMVGLYPWDWDATMGDRSEVEEKLGALTEARVFTTLWRRRDGTLLDMEISLTPAELDGQRRYITVCRDVSARKRAQQKLHRYTAQLTEMLGLAVNLRSAVGEEGIYDALMEHVPRLFETPSMAIALLEGDGSRFTVHRCSGQWLQLEKTSFPNSDLIARQVLQNTSVYFTSELGLETVFFSDGEEPKPALFLPLSWENHPIGLLAVSRDHGHNFESEEINMLISVGEIAGLSLNRAKLNDWLRQRVSHLEILRNVNLAVAGSLDFEWVLQTSLDEIIDQMILLGGVIYRQTEGELSIAKVRGFDLSNPGSSFRDNCATLAASAATEHRILTRPLIQGDAPFDFSEHSPTLHAVPLIAKGEVLGVLVVVHPGRYGDIPGWFDMLEALGRQLGIAMDSARLFDSLEKQHEELIHAYDATLQGWARALAMKEKETEAHSRRVVALTVRLARHLGFDEEQLVHIRRGALLHDIGKIGVPEEIILKAGPLNEHEWEVMKKHPEFAHALLAPIRYLKPALDIPYCHHEQWCGKGYPQGLKGEEIPLEARMFSVVDVYDALTRNRHYKEAWSEEDAKAYLVEQKGERFDPAVVDAFLEVLESGPSTT